MTRRGQTLSIDLGISLIVFTVAVLVTYQILEGTLDNSGYADVRREAVDAASLLSGEGYPTAWTNTTVIRAGITSDGVLSVRKTRELAALAPNDLRAALRATDDVAVYFENSSGEIEAVGGVCAIGDLVVTATPANRTLGTLSLARSPYAVSAWLNASVATNDSGLMQLERPDVLIIEGNISNGSARTPTQIARELDDLSRRGITIIVIGDPGAPMIGVATNLTNASHINITDASFAAGFPGSLYNTSGGAELAIPGLTALPSSPSVTDARALARTEDDAIAYATWIYHDARVYYFATSSGTFPDGTTAAAAIGNRTLTLSRVAWPSCPAAIAPSGASQVARTDRTIAYHDRLLTLRVLAWRNR